MLNTGTGIPGILIDIYHIAKDNTKRCQISEKKS